MKFLIFIVLAFVSQIALANTNCEGVVAIPVWNSDADVGVDFDKLEAGARMGLWAPITSDDSDYLVLDIKSTEALPNGGLLVKTQYLLEEISHLSFVFTKEADGTVSLQDFIGIEGGVEFGPGTLTCK